MIAHFSTVEAQHITTSARRARSRELHIVTPKAAAAIASVKESRQRLLLHHLAFASHRALAPGRR